MSLNLRAGDRDRGRSEEEVPRRSRMAPALRRQLDDVGGAWTPTGRSRMTPARQRQCQTDDCDYIIVVGLATKDRILKNLKLHLRFHETNCEKELHRKLHELTTDQTESAVEMKKNETNCEGDELWRENRPHKETNSEGGADLTPKIEASRMTKNILCAEENKPHCKMNYGRRADLTSRMEASRMNKNLLEGEMQEKISKENTKTPKYERCGHCDL